jgi:hypothetical protein
VHPLKEPHPKHAPSPTQTTQDYTVRYWPRLLSFYQQTVLWKEHGPNRLVAPVEPMGPPYRAVVAINDDTLYASAFVDTREHPVILTIPPAPAGMKYSLLVLDVFGNRVDVEREIPDQQPGTYALVERDYHGTLPPGAVKVPLPYPVTIWNIRVDKYSHDGTNLTKQADQFRQALVMGGTPTLMLAVKDFDVSVKVIADDLAQDEPKALLELMQEAVNAPSTHPMDPSDVELAEQFDDVFAAAKAAQEHDDHSLMLAISRAVVDAWTSIQSNWRDSAGPTGWTHPTNFAEWNRDYLDRASGNEFIQYGNNADAAGYWHTFVDQNGTALHGGRGSYRITFDPKQIPDATRFWSLTAYTPDSVELIENPANKYVVAGYTQGLAKNSDGSITVYISQQQSSTVPAANWLPVADRKFNIMLRVYGPTGNTDPKAKPRYVPPVITKD